MFLFGFVQQKENTDEKKQKDLKTKTKPGPNAENR